MAWKTTGEPAHNNAVRRSLEDQPSYEANPDCSSCGGTGEYIIEQPVRNYEGECVDVEFVNHPCDCIFVEWEVIPDPNCAQCNGSGAVQERMMKDGEQITFFYDCVCLRYVPRDDENEETKGDSH